MASDDKELSVLWRLLCGELDGARMRTCPRRLQFKFVEIAIKCPTVNSNTAQKKRTVWPTPCEKISANRAHWGNNTGADCNCMYGKADRISTASGSERGSA